MLMPLIDCYLHKVAITTILVILLLILPPFQLLEGAKDYASDRCFLQEGRLKP